MEIFAYLISLSHPSPSCSSLPSSTGTIHNQNECEMIKLIAYSLRQHVELREEARIVLHRTNECINFIAKE